ncbi:MAG: response regulator [Gammaproteobacteria bacterium]|nr:response regulator [Gammaproteobacteria bacterium]
MKYILAADDEAINRDIIEEILEDDYEVKCVEDGAECIESIKSRIPDLLLLDVGMPGMDGLEVCRVLRQSQATKDLPIFLLSGYAAKEDISSGLEAGADQYISKPFSPLELQQAVQNCLAN